MMPTSGLRLQVPVPPHMPMPATAQLLFTIWLGVPLVVVLGIAVRHLLSGRGPILLYFLIGGALASSWEAIVNVLGTMIYAEVGIWTAYSTFGRTIPILIPMAYTWFMGGQAYYCLQLFERGITRQRLFATWGVFCVVDAVIETPGLLAGVYTYYGAQPLNFWGFPIWYAWANSLVPVLAGAAVYCLRRHMVRGWASLGTVALVPMCNGVAYAATVWPIWSMLNTNLGYAGTYPAAAVALILSCFVLWIVSVATTNVHRSAKSGQVIADQHTAVPASW